MSNSGVHCAVHGCTYNWRKLKEIQQRPCFEHFPRRRAKCSCPEPFAFFKMPIKDDLRKQWLEALRRKNPPKNVYVCSFHFVDKKPTEQNPVPELYLGYDKEMKIEKRKKVLRCNVINMTPDGDTSTTTTTTTGSASDNVVLSKRKVLIEPLEQEQEKQSEDTTYPSSGYSTLNNTEDMLNTFSVCTSPNVKNEVEDITSIRMQQESGTDDLTDLYLEVEEETSDCAEDEATKDSWKCYEEVSKISQGAEYLPKMLNLVRNVSVKASNFNDGNEYSWNDQCSSTEHQIEGSNNTEYDPSLNIKLEEDSSDIEPERISDTVEQHPLDPTVYTDTELPAPEYIKQEVKTEAEDEYEMSNNHQIERGGSQLHNFEEYQLRDKSAVDYRSLNSHKEPHPVCLIRAADAESIELFTDERNKTVQLLATSLSINSVECCLVCNAPCVITENRKIPSLPFCRKCKKAYFYQLSHRYTPDNVYRNRECSAGGNCRIDHRQKKICPKCHHKKFLAVLKAAERLFKEPFKLLKSLEIKNQMDSDYQERDWSSIREDIMIQEAVKCQPVVSIERLDTDALLAQGCLKVKDNLSLIEQKPLNFIDPNGQIINNYFQPVYEVATGSSNNQQIYGSLPQTFRNPSPLVTHLTNSFKSPVVGPRCKLPKTINSDGGGKKLNSSVTARKVLKKSATSKRGRPCTKLNRSRPVDANEASARNIRKSKMVSNVTGLATRSDSLCSIADPQEDLCNYTTQNVSQNVSPYTEDKSQGVIGEHSDKKFVAGGQTTVLVSDWNNIHIFKRRRGRPLLKEKRQCKKNESAAVSVLTCGHACSKCNSAEINKWLQEHDYAVNPPLSFTINNDKLPFEEGTSSNSVLVFQKLCEINQLLQGRSQFYFDPKTGTLKFRTESMNSQAVATESPFSEILRAVTDKSAQQLPVNSAAITQPTILLIPPAQSAELPSMAGSSQSFLIPIPCSTHSFLLPNK